MVAPVPLKLPVDARILAGVAGDLRRTMSRGQDLDDVTRIPQPAHRTSPDDLVTAQVVGRVHSADGEDSDRSWHSGGSYVRSPYWRRERTPGAARDDRDRLVQHP